MKSEGSGDATGLKLEKKVLVRNLLVQSKGRRYGGTTGTVLVRD